MSTNLSALPSPRIKNLTGEHFGRLVVVAFAELRYAKTGGPKAHWLCRCDCGRELILASSKLTSGNTKSCGCLHRDMARHKKQPIDLTGQRFTLLTAIERVQRSSTTGGSLWRCRCDCGNERLVLSGNLRKGGAKACVACARNRKAALKTTHGESQSPEWNVFEGMHQRCENPNAPSFAYYGGRGITVCERWRSFENFLADVGKRPTPRHTLERCNNSLGYSPENCYWATRREQMRNTRHNHMITINGKTKCLAEWCEIFDMPYSLVHQRLCLTPPWTPERALTTPSQRCNTL